MSGSALKIRQIETTAQLGGRSRFVVLLPKLLQTPPCITWRKNSLFVTGMEPDQQSFDIRSEIDQLQVCAPLHPFRVAASPLVCRNPVGIEENERSTVPRALGIAAAALVDCIVNDPACVATTGNSNIEMNVEAFVVT